MTSTSANEIRAQAFRSLEGAFDVLVIGGGATGLGIALDAVTRGFRTALVEAGDFAQATSSRSTKLVHGGVRYLASGQIHLVREALHERAVMLRNAPHLVHPLPTILPATHRWELPWYGAGLSAYDLLSGSSSMGPTRILGRQATIERVPTIAFDKICGGVLYHDAQFNDARYALALARTAIDHGATVLNYARCTRFLYTGGMVSGAVIQAAETGAEATLTARAVINATGIFTDEMRTLDEPARPHLLSVSRGTHIVVSSRFLDGKTALMVPKTDDGRVIFALPWQGSVIVGTTDLPAAGSRMEPGYTPDEIDYLLDHIAPYLQKPIERGDIKAIFSGLRPLVTGKENKTSKLSREHHIDASQTGLITVAGGKWTTYRRMAQDTLDFAIRSKLLPAARCITGTVPLRGAPPLSAPPTGTGNPILAEYGTDAPALTEITRSEPSLAGPIDPSLGYTFATVAYAVRHELARTVEDVLSRRTRALLLDTAAAMRAAPAVARLMAKELGKDDAWARNQTLAFLETATEHYLPEAPRPPLMAEEADLSSILHPAP